MLKQIRQFFLEWDMFKESWKEFQERPKVPDEKKLMRNLLGSLDISQFKDLPEMEVQERKDFAARIDVCNKDMGKIIDSMINDQMKFAMSEATDLSFPRGTINGLFLLKERLLEYHSEHLENTKPVEITNPDETLAKMLADQPMTFKGPGQTI